MRRANSKSRYRFAIFAGKEYISSEMNLKISKIPFFVHVLLLAFSASFAEIPAINQLGFSPKSKKQLVLKGSDTASVEIRELMTNRLVARLAAPRAVYDGTSGDTVQLFDFSQVQKEGSYVIFREGKVFGSPVSIQKNPYRDLAKASLKWFYFQRAGMALEARYAGIWARPAGHLDTAVQIYGTDRKVSSPKGWYDAGDFGKYIVNSSITVSTLLKLYEDYPAYAKKLEWDIPRENKKLPAILEEVKWNLDWMLSMQDVDGGVFHKLTTLDFCGNIMPHEDTLPRFVIGKGITSSLGFAGTMAQASRVYRKFDKAYSQKLLSAAKRAYDFAKKNPTLFYEQPKDVSTGSYIAKGEDGKDEFRFAAAELFATTRKKNYLEDLNALSLSASGLWWGDLNLLAVFRVAESPTFGDSLVQTARTLLLETADALLADYDSSAYRVPVPSQRWTWGSNSGVANNGMALLQAYRISKDEKYRQAAEEALSYLLGKNPLRLSYVTGFGARSPMNPHHRQSEADSVLLPLPGMLVGGPHLGRQDVGENPWECPDYAARGFPAIAYLDSVCSYATNEVAINWNAPLAYLACALDAIP